MNSEKHAGPPAARTIDDTCRHLGIGRTAIYQALADGRLRAVKHGRRTLILSESADALLASLPAATFRATAKSAA